MDLKLVWVSLVFHGVMLLWLKEDGLPSFKKSKRCDNSSLEPSRLIVFILPGLRPKHYNILLDFDDLSVGWVKAHDPCPAVVSYFSGVSASPLLWNSLDTIFDHVESTVYSGLEDFPLEKDFLKIKMPLYYRRRAEPKSHRAELDAVEGLYKTGMSFESSPFISDKSLFLVNLFRLTESNDSLDAVRRLLYDLKQLVKSITFLSGISTNALLLGDRGGPFVAWGPDIARFRNFHLNASDVAPLLSGLMDIAVPHDSVGIFPHQIMRCGKKADKASLCNALQFELLNKEITQGPSMSDLNQMIPDQHVLTEFLRKKKPYDCANDNVSQYLRQLKEVYSKAKLRMNFFLLVVIVCTNVAWIVLLVVELASLTHTHVSKVGALNFIIHVVFGILTLAAISVPIFIKWPHSYLVYLACPFGFSWAACSRADVMVGVFKSVKWKKDVPQFLLYIAGILLLAEYSWESSKYDATSLIVGLCFFTLFPTFPRFSNSPKIIKIVWWFLCLGLLKAFFLPDWTCPQPKLRNLCGTIWICLTGFSSFWLKPLLDSLLLVLIALFSAASMMVHSLARAPELVDQLKYLTLPLMFVPFLSLIGRRRQKNRLFHIVFSTGALVILTSTRLEPLFYLVAILVCYMWTLMEGFRLTGKLGIDEMRRAIFLSVVVHTTAAITKTLPISYAHLGSPYLIPAYNLYREIMMFTCIMMIYFTMVHPQLHAYSSVLIVILGNAVASLWSVAVGSDSAALHLHGVTLCASFYLAVLFTPTSSKLDSSAVLNDIDLHN